MCEHINQVIDEHEGTIICLDCSHVILNQILLPSYPEENVEEKKNYDSNFCIYHQFIKDCCHRGHIIDVYARKSIECFEKLKGRINTDHKVDALSLAAYSIYHTLKEENVPRSLRMICTLTGTSVKAFRSIEHKYMSTPKSTNVHQMLHSKHHYFGLNNQDLKQLQNIALNYKNKSFSPNTLSAALIHLYLKHKSVPSNVKSVANIFQITPECLY